MNRPRCLLGLTALVILAAALVTSPAGARPVGDRAVTTSHAEATVPRPPLVLPGDATVSRVGAIDRSRWIIGGRRGATTARIADRFGAEPIVRSAGVYAVSTADARKMASALRRAGQLTFAEPNARATRSSIPKDPLFSSQYWLPQVVDPDLTPPPTTDRSPSLAIVDDQVDASHPEFEGARLSRLYSSYPVADGHGTSVAAVAGAPANGVGITGVWPGMPLISAATDLSCADLTATINDAVEAGVSVINMSYGGGFCFAHYVATQLAFGSGVVLVAAGGNDFENGNQPVFPASLPHVMTVAATDQGFGSALFSNRNEGIDVAAPGVDVLTAVPHAFDDDGTPDGYTIVDGTSFSAPMVAAAAAWVMQARPSLWNDQVVSVLNASARDLGPRGWDERFGWGFLDVRAALSERAPRHDPNEPNDDIEWVNGTFFRPDRPIFGARSRTGKASGSIDQWEDEADVYRVVFPARRSVRVTLQPRFGDPDLYVFNGRAKDVWSRRGLMRRSIRGGRRKDSVVIRNRGRRPIRGYVAVRIDESVKALSAGYALNLKRVR